MLQKILNTKKYSYLMIIIVTVILFYVATRILYYHVTSPKKLDKNEGLSVYEVCNLLDTFMSKHDISINKGSEEYVNWLSDSLSDQLNKEVLSDLKNQKWYNGYETYATAYLQECQMVPSNSIMNTLGYHTVVPKGIRDRTIKQLQDKLHRNNN